MTQKFYCHHYCWLLLHLSIYCSMQKPCKQTHVNNLSTNFRFSRQRRTKKIEIEWKRAKKNKRNVYACSQSLYINIHTGFNINAILIMYIRISKENSVDLKDFQHSKAESNAFFSIIYGNEYQPFKIQLWF